MAMKGFRLKPNTHFHANRQSNSRLCEKFLVAFSITFIVIVSQFNTLDALPIRRHKGGLLRRSALGRTSSFPPCLEDYVGARAYRSQTVFEGKARSKSFSRNGIYNVTFVVHSVLKGASIEGSQVRLQFNEKLENSHTTCSDGKSIVSANITHQANYIVFIDRIGPHIFRAHREPVRRNRRNLKEIQSALCGGCVRSPVLASIRDVRIHAMDKLRLTCKLKEGNPMPVLHWYKDEKRIKPDKRTKIQMKNRKRSVLIIKSVRVRDAGIYRCQATSATKEIATSSSHVTIVTRTREENSTTSWPFYGVPCETASYCLNGGTCRFFDTIGEHACLCAEGFKGQRCESKDASNQSSTHRHKYSCPIIGPCSYYS